MSGNTQHDTRTNHGLRSRRLQKDPPRRQHGRSKRELRSSTRSSQLSDDMDEDNDANLSEDYDGTEEEEADECTTDFSPRRRAKSKSDMYTASRDEDAIPGPSRTTLRNRKSSAVLGEVPLESLWLSLGRADFSTITASSREIAQVPASPEEENSDDEPTSQLEVPFRHTVVEENADTLLATSASAPSTDMDNVETPPPDRVRASGRQILEPIRIEEDPDLEYTCLLDGCGLTFVVRKLRDHIRNDHHRKATTNVECTWSLDKSGTYCGAQIQAGNLARHIISNHLSGAVRYKCPLCGVVGVWRKDACRRHIVETCPKTKGRIKEEGVEQEEE